MFRKETNMKTFIKKYSPLTIILLIICIISIVFNVVQQVHINHQTNRMNHFQDNSEVMTNYLLRKHETQQTTQSIEELITQIQNENVQESTVNMVHADYVAWTEWAGHFVLSLQYTTSTETTGWFWLPEKQIAHLNQDQKNAYHTITNMWANGRNLIQQSVDNMDAEKLEVLQKALSSFDESFHYKRNEMINPNEIDKGRLLQTFEKSLSELDSLLIDESSSGLKEEGLQ